MWNSVTASLYPRPASSTHSSIANSYPPGSLTFFAQAQRAQSTQQRLVGLRYRFTL